MPKISKIIGCPGGGKTTRVMQLIEQATKKYDPERIGAVSLTNAAVEEIKDRVSANTVVSKPLLKNIRTMHSHCYRMLGLGSDDMAEKHIKDFNEKYPQFAIPPASATRGNRDDEEEENQQDNKYTQKLFADMNILRNRLTPMNQWPTDVVDMWTAWKAWMDDEGLLDFTGYMERVIEEKLMLDVDVLFVDESQDLSQLQVNLIETWSQGTVATLYVGDSDQAIFRFSGSVPEAFINIKAGYNERLDRSYRLPSDVHRYAMEVIRQACNREDFDYVPNPERGVGNVISCMEPDLSLEGTHMIICRCNYQTAHWVNMVMSAGHAWHNPYRPDDKSWNPQLTQSWEVVSTWLSLLDGQYVDFKRLRKMVHRMYVDGNLDRGAKTKITRDMKDPQPMVNLMDLKDLGFLPEVLEKHVSDIFNLSGKAGQLISNRVTKDTTCESFNEKPRIIIGTCHSVKGGESDHVWVDTTTTPRIYGDMMTNDNSLYDEARVAYVAVTRAKQTVGILGSYRRNPVFPSI